MNTKGSQVYQELGGDAAIEILAEKLNERVLADPIFEDHFKDMSRRVLEKHPKEYLKVVHNERMCRLTLYLGCSRRTDYL